MLTVYKASAGSGKTYRLAYEYVRMLLGVKDELSGRYHLDLKRYTNSEPRVAAHRRILAITFTNKATEEMKSRIVQELASLASDHADGSRDCDFVADLIAEYGCTREELRDVASRALRSLLFDYHHFNVSTIDSFFQSVLRSFAREVDHQGDYGLELNDDFAVTSGIGLMLDDLNYGNPPRRRQMMDWISHYTMSLVEKGKDGSFFNRSGNLLRRLANYVSKMDSEVFKKHSAEVLRYLEDPLRMKAFTDAIDSHIGMIETSLASGASQILDDYINLGLAIEAMPSTVQNVLKAVKDKQGIDPVDALKKVGIQKLLEFPDTLNPSFYVKKYLAKNGKEVIYPPEAFSLKLSETVREIIDRTVEIHGLQKIAAACPSLEFLGFTWHYIDRFRSENNLILLSDTNDLLQRIIGESSAPFIYERIGVALRHFLIDEFQDTSHMQWDNIKPLVADSLAEGNDNLIIGDEKQAIYRFRNSDSSLLHHVVINEDFPTQHKLRGNSPAENTNYRSSVDIVRFNNTLFTRVARNRGLDSYSNTIQTPSKTYVPGLVRIYDTSEREKINDMPAEFDITAAEMLRQHEAGYRWSEMAVLVRTGKEAEQMVNYLLKYHPEIPVISDEALMLRNSPAVKLIVSMLKLVDDSYAVSSREGINTTEGKAVYGSVDDIRMMVSRYDYFNSEGISSEEALRMALDASDNEMGLPDINDSIIDIHESRPSGLVSLVETIIAKKISPSRRISEYAYLAAFQDEVIKYCANFNPSVHSFLQWWGEASDKLTITSGSGLDAVTVMTVHKSKGLQWPCVHVPFGDWNLVRPNDKIWIKPRLDFVAPEYTPPLLAVDIDSKCLYPSSPLYRQASDNQLEQLVDNINVTYVAYTRAERELIICFGSHTRVGNDVFRAIEEPEVDDDLAFCVDLAAHRCQSAEDGLVFELGTPTTPIHKIDESKEAAESLRSGEYKVYFRKDTSQYTTIDDATAEAGDIMSDSERQIEVAHADPNLPEALVKAAERGIILHAVMAGIDSLDDIDNSLARTTLRLKLTIEQSEEYAAVIHNAFHHAGQYVKSWFNPVGEVLKEQSIYVPEGDMTLRPDRIILHDDGLVEVVDYKFTTEPLPSHRRQVEGYVNLLNAMGYNVVKGFLWYPELKKIIEVKSKSQN